MRIYRNIIADMHMIMASVNMKNFLHGIYIAKGAGEKLGDILKREERV